MSSRDDKPRDDDIGEFHIPEFYWRLYGLCYDKGITLTQLTNGVGMARSLPDRWAEGKPPTNSHLKKIAKYFNVDVDYFSKSPNPRDLKMMEKMGLGNLIAFFSEWGEFFNTSKKIAKVAAKVAASIPTEHIDTMRKVAIIFNNESAKKIAKLAANMPTEDIDTMRKVAAIVNNESAKKIAKMAANMPTEHIDIMRKVTSMFNNGRPRKNRTSDADVGGGAAPDAEP